MLFKPLSMIDLQIVPSVFRVLIAVVLVYGFGTFGARIEVWFRHQLIKLSLLFMKKSLHIYKVWAYMHMNIFLCTTCRQF